MYVLCPMKTMLYCINVMYCMLLLLFLFLLLYAMS